MWLYSERDLERCQYFLRREVFIEKALEVSNCFLCFPEKLPVKLAQFVCKNLFWFETFWTTLERDIHSKNKFGLNFETAFLKAFPSSFEREA